MLKEVIKILRILKNIFIHIRSSIRLIFLLIASAIIVYALFKFVYRPMYSVTFNGEFVGYVEDKSKLENDIKNYMKTGEGGLVAFVEIPTMPEYQVCLLKKDKTPNDEQIYNMVKDSGIPYYKFYAITVSEEEKLYVETKQQAEDVIYKLKEKNSTNKASLGYTEKYEKEIPEFKSFDDAVDELYVAPVRTVTYYAAESSGTVGYLAGTNDYEGLPINIGLEEPTSGVIMSRFGMRGSSYHTGIDVANSMGTTIYAAADGVVKFTGWYGGYGNLVIITHYDGLETYYAHCQSILVTADEPVSQGQPIALMGSTGNSTGPHLHMEVRVDGVAQNPQSYVYFE